MISLLRIEAVNLANTILDTDDLSTRRGGSYMLIRAIRDVKEVFAQMLSPISTGASTGLFEIKAGKPLEVGAAVRKFVAEHLAFRHASFVVATAEGEFKAAHEQCIAHCRWQQMQSLAVRCAWSSAAQGDVPAERVCDVDGVRPAVRDEWFGGQVQRSVSESVRMRRFDGTWGGKKLRQEFYQHELAGEANGLDFTDDFKKLARPSDGDDTVPRALRDKIAVFYADGNGFGKLQGVCEEPCQLRQWDESLRARRRRLLSRLLAHARSRQAWRTGDNEIRLETLLWGGDELTFVVPAWCGLELAHLFFEETADWCYPDDERQPDCEPPPGLTEPRPLTHAASIVFAHRNAPIRRLEHLAHALVEQAKNDGGGSCNSLSWIALESFDHAGADPSGYLVRRYPEAAFRPTWVRLRLDAFRLSVLRQGLPLLRDVLPRSAMTRALNLLVRGQVQHPLLERSYESVEAAVPPELSTAWHVLWQAVAGRAWSKVSPQPGDTAAWTVLLELWDYTL